MSRPFLSFPKTVHCKLTVAKMLYSVWNLVPPTNRTHCEMFMSATQNGIRHTAGAKSAGAIPAHVDLKQSAYSDGPGFGDTTNGQELGKP